MNLKRRHLTESQRAMIGARLANIEHGGDRKSEKIKGQICPPTSQPEEGLYVFLFSKTYQD
jgi:hypothetical protein